MNCIIIDDEPLAREAMEMLVEENKELCLLSMFNNAVSAARFMEEHSVDLIFLDIQMPGITGIEFAHTVSKRTLITSPLLIRNMHWIVMKSMPSTIWSSR